MAQKPGAERFLASLAERASARVILALALAALALAGCGGGDSDGEEGTGAPASAETSAAGGPSAPGTASPGASQGGGEEEAESSNGSGTASGSPGQGGTGPKQGPRVAAPKGAREQAPTPQEAAEATVADIVLQSPAIVPSPEGPGALPATYTCDGSGAWPELRWAGVPPGSAELVLYAMGVQPVEEGKLFVAWAVAGLDPALTGIEAGKLPKGAVVGTNSLGRRGYEICPPAGSGEIYMFALYALPSPLSPQKGFDARELRKEILGVSGNVGLLPATYARG